MVCYMGILSECHLLGHSAVQVWNKYSNTVDILLGGEGGGEGMLATQICDLID